MSDNQPVVQTAHTDPASSPRRIAIFMTIFGVMFTGGAILAAFRDVGTAGEVCGSVVSPLSDSATCRSAISDAMWEVGLIFFGGLVCLVMAYRSATDHRAMQR